MTTHHITRADTVLVGSAYNPGHAQNYDGRTGAPVSFLRQVDLGAPLALDVDGIMDAATSTELPDTATITYTAADDDGTTPFDNADTPAPSDFNGTTVWALDVPRNLSLNVTHASSIVAMSVTITGWDQYGAPLQETLSVTATGTAKTSAGLKAWKYISTIAVTSAADATTNTANLGWGDVLGMPYRVDGAWDIIGFWADGTEELGSATLAAAVTTTATATTGDVRGTVTPNTATDASVNYRALLVLDPSTDAALFGVSQFGG